MAASHNDEEAAMTIEQLRTNVDRLTDAQEWRESERPIPSLTTLYEGSFSGVDRLAIWVTDHVGSMGFFLLLAVWTGAWLAWNTLAPVEWRFDPAPAFVLWLFISNLIQIHLMPLIMVGQNLQGRHEQLRDDLEFQVNLKAEREIETVLEHLTNQNELMLEIVRRLERIEGRRAGATAG
jgi:uncharacterized membrane protein